MSHGMAFKGHSNLTQLQFLAFLFVSCLPVKPDPWFPSLFMLLLFFSASLRFTWNASFPETLAGHLNHFLFLQSYRFLSFVYRCLHSLSWLMTSCFYTCSTCYSSRNYKFLEGGEHVFLFFVLFLESYTILVK